MTSQGKDLALKLRYVGEYNSAGVEHGLGACVFPNGNRYEGQWIEGKRTGKGKYIYANGCIYEGDVVDGQLHGHGKLLFANKNHYEGEFRNGKREGKGLFSWNDGEYYKGEFRNDKRDGYGEYHYSNKDLYKGRFADGLKHGCGTYFYSNNDQYIGHFKEGQRHGFGLLKLANGTSYEGQFANDKQNGYGVLRDNNGDVFEGNFVDDKKDGKALYFRREDGTVWEEKWKLGELVSTYLVCELMEEETKNVLSQNLGPGAIVESHRDMPVGDKVLPLNVALKIFSFLNARDISRSAQTCKSWEGLASLNPVWEELCKRRFQIDPREAIQNWKKAYQAKLNIFITDANRQGTGTYVFRNNNVYEGSWDTNQRHGYGRMLYFTNTHPLSQFIESYEGQWEHGKKSGFGIMTWTNGDQYKGEFLDGKREGKGTLVMCNQDRYEGEWKDGQLNGFGKVVKANGIVYQGEFLNGEKHGIGRLVYGGATYEGSWKDGNKDGWGHEAFPPDYQLVEVEYSDGKTKEEIQRKLGIPKSLPSASEQRLLDRQARRKKLQASGYLHKQPPKGRKKKKPPFIFPPNPT